MEAFAKLKEDFLSLPILVHDNPYKESRIEVDTSKDAMGGTLSQKQEDRVWHPCAYWTMKFNKAERFTTFRTRSYMQ